LTALYIALISIIDAFYDITAEDGLGAFAEKNKFHLENSVFIKSGDCDKNNLI